MNQSLLTISQEFMVAGKSGDHTSFTSKLSALGENIRNLFTGNGNVVSTQDTRYSHNHIVHLRRYINDSQEYETYMAIREKGVKVPPGFKGSMAEYTTLLDEAIDIVNALDKTYITPIEKHLAIILADPSKFKKSISSDCPDVGGTAFTHMYDQLNKYIDGTLNSDQSSLGAHYGRLKDVDTTFDNLIKIMVKKEASGITPSKMKSRAQLISGLIDRLIIRMKQKPEQFELNGINAELVGKLTYTLARAFEFYATIMNTIDITTYAVVDTFDAM